MGFKYVLVPASPTDGMEELEYGEDIEDLAKDTFRTHVERYYAAQGGAVDRSVLLEQLKQRTGVDLEDKASSGDLNEAGLQRLLSSTSVEIFPVMMPTKQTGFESISVYCDDKGVAKGLPENPRVSGLVQAAGFVGQTFRGDCFVGRVFDDTEDVWKRTDFTLADCSSDAGWVAKCKAQRENRSSSDMSSLASKIGSNNAVNLNMAGATEAPEGETEAYKWRQDGDDVEITFKQEGLTKGDKKNVKVDFGREKLKVTVHGQKLIEGRLFAPIEADESTWTLSDGILQITMVKSGAGNWDDLLRA